MRLRPAIALLAFAAACGAAEDPAEEPGRAEQAKVLADATRYALNHWTPDFTCLQTTRRLENSDGTDWSPEETVVERLTYVHHHESYQVLEIDGRPESISHEHVQGARSATEFGPIMRSIFLPRTQTEFAWRGWVTVRGVKMQAYTYHVRAYLSLYHFELREKSVDLASAYHGVVLIDDAYHFVNRITLVAEDIPASFSIRNVSFELDYAPARIGSADYMLPHHFELQLHDGRGFTRHAVDYSSYDKVDPVSSLTRSPAAEGR